MINSKNSGIILPSGTASSICMSDSSICMSNIVEEEVPLMENPRIQNRNRVIFKFTIRKANFYLQSYKTV